MVDKNSNTINKADSRTRQKWSVDYVYA